MAEQGAPVAVITGASSGVGKHAAIALAGQGWRIIGVGRDAQRLAAAEAEIRAAGGAQPVTMLTADLSLLAEVDRLADEIAGLTPRLDLLANNAGGMAAVQVMTAEGLEANFVGNYLGHFVLTERLLPLLKATAASRPPRTVRIVNTSSDASEMIPGVDPDDMQGLSDYSVGGVYCRGKLANVLHAKALAGRLEPVGIVAHAFHPGTVDSNFFSGVSAQTRAYTDTLAKITEAEGADTLVWLATADEPAHSNGLYWCKRALREPNPLVNDADFVDRFWKASEALAGSVAR